MFIIEFYISVRHWNSSFLIFLRSCDLASYTLAFHMGKNGVNATKEEKKGSRLKRKTENERIYAINVHYFGFIWKEIESMKQVSSISSKNHYYFLIFCQYCSFFPLTQYTRSPFRARLLAHHTGREDANS